MRLTCKLKGIGLHVLGVVDDRKQQDGVELAGHGTQVEVVV